MRSKTNVIQITVLALFFSWLCSGLALASTHVEPGRFIFPLEPGVQANGAIKVTNTGDEEIEVRAVLYDWTLDENDQLVTLPSNSREDTLHGMIKFNPRQFKLGAKESQMVRFTISLSKDVSPIERRGIVFFEQEKVVEEGIGATVVTQVGTTIYVTPTTTNLQFRLAASKVHFADDGSKLGVMLIANEGAAHVRYRIAYRIVDEKRAIVAKEQLEEKVILPAFRRLVVFPVEEELGPGKYSMILEITFFGTDNTLVHTIPFEVPGQE